MTRTANPPTPAIVRLEGRERDGIQRRNEPVTLGVPLPRGAVREARELRLRRDSGEPEPLQARIVDRWSDGTARWVHLDFQVDCEAHSELAYELHLDRPDDPSPSPTGAVRVSPTEEGWFVDTGAAQFLIDRGRFLPFRSVRAGGLEVLDPTRCRWGAVDADGNRWEPRVETVAVETEGALRSTLRVAGGLVREGAGRPLLDYVARLHFHAASASCRLQLMVRNSRAAKHPGGHWHLGDPGSVLVKDLSFELATLRGRRVSWSLAPNAPLASGGGDTLEIYQDSSGGGNWRSRIHLDRDGRVPTSFRGYRVRTGDAERTGERATPRVAVHDGRAGVSASMRHFWQEFPKAIEAAGGVLSVRLFPSQFAALHEIQGGEQKTHEVVLAFGDAATGPAADAFRAPLLVHAEPSWFEASGAIPYLTTRDRDANALHGKLVDSAIEGVDRFEEKRERADVYGWRHFGETWADHEAKYWEGEGTFVSHYNNQYDVVYGAFLQFVRSGDPRWFRMHAELARHVADIDIYHTDEDKAAYNHGLFWHTVHYIDGDTSTHRSYPRGSCGGGPDDEHNYTTGLMHYWLLTGDEAGHENALGSARWVIDADDGSRTILKWIDRGPTGLASKTREFGYHGPGRGAGNSLNALIDGWRMTGDETFLAKASEILRRTVHPADPLDDDALLDAENRWSYTVHLQALGKYLDTKAEAGQLDADYAWAKASLLHYARWMAERERPILDVPDDLEYPNETWAAQDIRKSDVFRFAALHSRGDERERFRERGEHFFRSSTESLDGFDTKTYTRPVILMMHYGLMQSWFDHHPDDDRPVGPDLGPVGAPPRFVPQKTRALRKLRLAVAVGGAAVAVAAVMALRALA